MKKFLYLTIAFSVAIALRLYPTFLSGLPFSTDAWTPIRNTELLMAHTPIDLGDDKLFDGYNNYWPANSLFGAILSHVTGLKPITAMGTYIPLTGALAIPIFYALVNRISRDREVAFVASVLLATTYTHAILTAGVTKETFANPLYISCILIFLSQGGWRGMFLFTIASIALVMAHHLTTLITITILAFIWLAISIYRFKQGKKLEKSSFLYVVSLAAITALYFNFYAMKGFKITLALSDWISASSYQMVALAISLYLIFKPAYSRVITLLMSSTALAVASLIALLATKRPVIPSAPTLPEHYILYAIPFIILSPLLVLGFEKLLEMRSDKHKAPILWFASILALEGYAVFGNTPLGHTLAYRAINFLSPPLAILGAFGIQRLRLMSKKPSLGKMTKLAATLALLLIVSTSSYAVYAAVSLQEKYMGYFWLYTMPEYKASSWISGISNNKVIAGDVKTSYLLNEYFDKSVDVLKGFQYLNGKTSSKPEILFVYKQMIKNGYVIHGGLSIDLPENWAEKTNDLDHIYSNGIVDIYGGS